MSKVVESEETSRGGVRIRVALDAAEVSRGEAVTGRLEIQVDEPHRKWVPELCVALRGGTAAGDSRDKIEQTVLNRRRAESSELQKFRFSLHVPASMLLGSAQLVLTAGRGMSTWVPVLRVPLTILPERCFLEVIELINSLADHWMASWTTSAEGGGIYARLLPGPKVQDSLSGITVELNQVGRHVCGELTVTTRQRTSWMDFRESNLEWRFQTPRDDLTQLRKELNDLLQPLLGEERQLPIPSHSEESSDWLPIPASGDTGA